MTPHVFDNLRAVIASEDRVHKARAAADADAAWVSFWLAAGHRRTAQVALLAGAMAR